MEKRKEKKAGRGRIRVSWLKGRPGASESAASLVPELPRASLVEVDSAEDGQGGKEQATATYKLYLWFRRCYFFCRDSNIYVDVYVGEPTTYVVGFNISSNLLGDFL